MPAQETNRDDLEVVEVRRSVELDASVDEVWTSLARLDRLADWLDVTIDENPDGESGNALGDPIADDAAPPRLRPGGVGLSVGAALRLIESDGSRRHLLITELDPGRRVAWHWWREDGELSAVEVTLGESSGPGAEQTTVTVIERLALSSATAGGRAVIEVVNQLDQHWDEVLPGLSGRLARKLGVTCVR